MTGRYASRLRYIDGQLTELGDEDALFLNQGDGTFTPAVWSEHFREPDGRASAPTMDYGLSVQIRDINGDGFPDIYVANDFVSNDLLYIG